MAAITSVLRVLTRPGTTLVVPADGYYQVRRYAVEYLAPQGITVIEAKCADIIDAAVGCRRGACRDAVEPRPRCGRSSSPGDDVSGPRCDARRRQHHRDSAWAATVVAGADLVVASATKTLSGHHDLLAGYVAGSHADQMAAIEHERRLAGPILGAFEAWLVLRSIGTAGLRFERQCQNALAMALTLRAHPAVRSVRYPGLTDDPSHEVANRQMKRFGGIVAIELESAAAVHALVQNSDLLVSSTSFGGIHSSVDRRARWGDPVGEGFAADLGRASRTPTT